MLAKFQRAWRLVKRTHNPLLLWILLLALVRGGLYASYLPPWSLIDEEQHVHYIQYIAENHRLPIIGQLYLSPEIVESVFETRRWEAFHWPPHAVADPRLMGLEGHSYEGYQPPLFYILAAFFYTFLPGTMLFKVFVLRGMMVVLSLVTILVCYMMVRKLWPQYPTLPYVICLILILVPERTMAVSRVNNDGLLEVVAAVFVWGCTLALLSPPSIRQSGMLGLVLGLGVLTKTSMGILAVLLPVLIVKHAYIANLHRLKGDTRKSWFSFLQEIFRLRSDWRYHIFWMATALLVAPFVIRNLYLYGDYTGFAGFKNVLDEVGGFKTPGFTVSNLKSAFLDLFRHFWVVWRGDMLARDRFVPRVCLGILTILSGFSVWGWIRYLRELHQKHRPDAHNWVLFAYVLAVGAYDVMILFAYFGGMMPVIQGRFLLPVVLPIVILFGLGLWHSPGRKWLVGMAVFVLFILDSITLANSLYYHYYLSNFVDSPDVSPWMAWGTSEMWAVFYPRFLYDKPNLLRPFLLWLVPLYLLVLILVGAAFNRYERNLRRLG